MNRQQILLALSLREADLGIKVATFDDRLILQKAVCLLQYDGVNLAYRFRWHLRGPYSSELASDAFFLAAHRTLLDEELKAWKLDEQSKARINQIKDLFSGLEVRALVKRLELLASILFMVRTGQAKPDDWKPIDDLLKINGKQFTETHIKEALATLSQYGFIH
jgi:uncharacterized protein YwgA